MAKYRLGSVYVRDLRSCSIPRDRNAIARILALSEALERKTKAKGRRNGCLGGIGLTVLRALLLRYQNRATGICCPSYDALQAETGLCRQSIANALDRLEACGILTRLRRIVREVVAGIVVTRQASNLYSLHEPRPGAGEGAPACPARPFPTRGPLAALAATLLRRTESTAKTGTTSPIHLEQTKGWRSVPDWRTRMRMARQV